MHVHIEESNLKRGRKPGLAYRQLEMSTFIRERGLDNILMEHGRLMQEIALVENVQLLKTAARARYEEVTLHGTKYKGVVELSTKLLYESSVEAQKNAFVKAISHFIAYDVFKVTAGQEYALFVKRYLAKKIKTQETLHNGTILRVN